MKAFCCECGRPVRRRLVNGEWEYLRCVEHPNAKRYLKSWADKQFAKLRALGAQVGSIPGGAA